jgi:hypothetical protein
VHRNDESARVVLMDTDTSHVDSRAATGSLGGGGVDMRMGWKLKLGSES